MSAPTVGTFVRPVGRCYCLRIDRVAHVEDFEVWECTRFGLAEDRLSPCDDGGPNCRTYLSNLDAVAPNVWRQRSNDWSGPRYWRAMRPRGQQLDLWGNA